jgi:hypothetical protein
VDGLTLLDIVTIKAQAVVGHALKLVGKQQDLQPQNSSVKLVEVLVVLMLLDRIIKWVITFGAGAQAEAKQHGIQIDHKLITDTQYMLDNTGKLVTNAN